MLGVIGMPSPSNTPIAVPITVNNVYANLACSSANAPASSLLSWFAGFLF
jgi:hypothetical protein